MKIDRPMMHRKAIPPMTPPAIAPVCDFRDDDTPDDWAEDESVDVVLEDELLEVSYTETIARVKPRRNDPSGSLLTNTTS